MPLERLICYCDSCKGNKALPVDDALRHAADREGGRFTFELLAAMLATVQDRGTRVSTTTLTSKCLRSEAIQRTSPYAGDPARMYPAFRGTMFHGQLELHAHPDAKEEPRFHKELFGEGGSMFSGSPDLVDPHRGKLYDYKFNKENPRYDFPWKDHVLQGQVNRWLCDTADYVQWRNGLYPLTERGADLITEQYGCENPGVEEWDLELNRERFIPEDWQGIYVVYMDDRGPKPLLCTKSIDVPTKDGKRTKKARVADIWSDAEVESFVLERFKVVQAAFAAVEQGVVPPIEPDFHLWSHPLCDWCPVKDECVSRYLTETRAS